MGVRNLNCEMELIWVPGSLGYLGYLRKGDGRKELLLRWDSSGVAGVSRVLGGWR